MEHISNRIRQAMELREISQIELSRRSGIDKGSLSRYLSGKVDPKRSAIAKLASALYVSPAWLLGMDVPMTLMAEPVDDNTAIPVLGTVAAGRPMYAEENIVGMELVSPALGKNIFALQSHGNSMEPKISDGDIVIVRQQEDAECGQVVIALVGDEEATCKKLMKYDDGTLALVPFNPAYSPIIFPAGKADMKIIGVVLESRSKF